MSPKITTLFRFSSHCSRLRILKTILLPNQLTHFGSHWKKLFQSFFGLLLST